MDKNSFDSVWNDGIAIFECRLLLSFYVEGFGNQRKLRNKIKIRSVQSHLNDPNYHRPLLYVKDHDTHANHYKKHEIMLVGKGYLGKYKMGSKCINKPNHRKERWRNRAEERFLLKRKAHK